MVSRVRLGKSRESTSGLAGQVWFQALGTRAQVAGEPHPECRWLSSFMGLEQLLERDLPGCQGNILCPFRDSCCLDALFIPQLGSRRFCSDTFRPEGLVEGVKAMPSRWTPQFRSTDSQRMESCSQETSQAAGHCL